MCLLVKHILEEFMVLLRKFLRDLESSVVVDRCGSTEELNSVHRTGSGSVVRLRILGC